MDPDDWDWAIARVEEAAEASEQWVHASGYDWKSKARLRVEFSTRLGPALDVLDRLAPDRAATIRSATDGTYIADNLRIAAAQLRIRPEVERRLGPQGPRLAAARLHHTVWGAVVSLWDTEHYRQAVSTAAQAVNAHLQNKVQRRDIGERDLVAQTFSTKDPEADAPRLRFPDVDQRVDPDTWRSRHDGAKFFGMGLFAGVRNLVSHGDPSNELEADSALEYLASFSVLARWIDEARLVTAETREVDAS